MLNSGSFLALNQAVPLATNLGRHGRIPVSKTILDRLAVLGINVSKILERSSLGLSRFRPYRAILTTTEFEAFFRAIGDLAGARDIGLRLASTVQPHQLDVASLAALHSRNLGDALHALVRYAHLLCAGHADMTSNDREVRVSYHWMDPGKAPPLLFVDFVMASVFDIARRGSARSIKPIRLELARRRSDETMLTAHFGCEVRFDASVDLLVFDRSALSQPFETQNEDLARILISALQELCDDSLVSRSIADDVKAIIRHHMDGRRLSIESVASMMTMSPRTLQRRLCRLNTTYQKLLDEVRHDAARRLLRNTDLDGSAIAFLLGFEEANSFGRAFFAWEGATPTRWRLQACAESS